MRAKRFQRPLSWRSLSLSRKDHLKSESRRSKGALFRSPSIYEDERETMGDEDKEDGDVMASYLAEKICPLTPSQKPTNISHLVQRNPQLSSPSMEVDGQQQQQPDIDENPLVRAVIPASSTAGSFCSIM
jgi:hypothetical protein